MVRGERIGIYEIRTFVPVYQGCISYKPARPQEKNYTLMASSWPDG